MKITAVKTVVVNAEMRNWVFVKIETDQQGLYGWGEASLEWKTRAVANATALHFALSTPNFLIQEDMLVDVPWRWEVVQHNLKTENGYWLPTNAPGLGIEVNEANAKRYPFKQEVLHPLTVRAHKGGILDW